MTDWRLIPVWQGAGAFQMAIDQWLFEQCHAEMHPPALRFYTWSPSAISLGHHQRQWPSHWQALTWRDRPLELVRRPTGGRAVLHAADLTYSIVLPDQSGHRRETYNYICGFLIQGFQALGIELQLGMAGRGYQRQVNCFESATAADLIGPNGEKLIGSAQVWRGQTVLQHGSIQLNPDPVLLSQVFGTEAGTPQLLDRLHQSRPPHPNPSPTRGEGLIPAPLARSGRGAGGEGNSCARGLLCSVAMDQVIEALVKAAEDYFGITFVLKPLTLEEWETIRGYVQGITV
jgi:lipoate---protein ligase